MTSLILAYLAACGGDKGPAEPEPVSGGTGSEWWDTGDVLNEAFHVQQTFDQFIKNADQNGDGEVVVSELGKLDPRQKAHFNFLAWKSNSDCQASNYGDFEGGVKLVNAAFLFDNEVGIDGCAINREFVGYMKDEAQSVCAPLAWPSGRDNERLMALVESVQRYLAVEGQCPEKDADEDVKDAKEVKLEVEVESGIEGDDSLDPRAIRAFQALAGERGVGHVSDLVEAFARSPAQLFSY